MIKINDSLKNTDLAAKIERLGALSREKITAIEKSWDPAQGTPVFTINGKYTSRGWTEWTQGFQLGLYLLNFELAGDYSLIAGSKGQITRLMPSHLTNSGVHDHGFNTISTYGNLLRLIKQGDLTADNWEKLYYHLAVKVSGSVQAMRWTNLPDNLGYICSFNGPHSLFVDTIRTLRVLDLAYLLGHKLLGENDKEINLLQRVLKHAETTARFNVFPGSGKDFYDKRGRVSHESIFNLNDGNFRCPSSQQGYSPFTTWSRGLAWILTGFAEQIEFIDEILTDDDVHKCRLSYFNSKNQVLKRFISVARDVADFYIANTPTCGIPYWDSGAPQLYMLGDYLDMPANPYNAFEPVDSSAAAILAQGFLRLGSYLQKTGDKSARKYYQTGLTITDNLFSEPYLSLDTKHQGLILHSVYHRPNGWDYMPQAGRVPYGESSMWGDYHALETAVYLQATIKGKEYHRFFNIETTAD